MRALLLVMILGSSVSADATLETVIKRGRLDAKVVTRELGKLQAKAKFTKPIAPARCVVVADAADLILQCNETVCPGACQVGRNEATLRVRNGTWSVTATTAKHLGDTGACGCCL